jgi:hypothetical protein
MRQDLLPEQCQVVGRVFVSDVATLAHHQEMAEAATWEMLGVRLMRSTAE